MKNSLPPLVKEIKNGKVTWDRVENIDHEVLGYFLSCHLIIEHYLHEFMCARWPDADWDAAQLKFSQKVSILNEFKISDKYDCIPAIKHMNKLRNKLSHNIDYQISSQDLLPMIQYLEKVYESKQNIPTGVLEILDSFTSMVCVLFAGGISGLADQKKLQR